MFFSLDCWRMTREISIILMRSHQGYMLFYFVRAESCHVALASLRLVGLLPQHPKQLGLQGVHHHTRSSGVYLLTWFTTFDMNLDRLAEEVFVRFLTVKFFSPPFHAVFFGRKSLCVMTPHTHLRNGSYILSPWRNYLVFFMENVSLLSYFFFYSAVCLYWHEPVDTYFIHWVVTQ